MTAYNSTLIHGWDCKPVDGQLWYFERESLSAREVSDALGQVLPLSKLLPVDSSEDEMYLLPPRETAEELYRETRDLVGQLEESSCESRGLCRCKVCGSP